MSVFTRPPSSRLSCLCQHIARGPTRRQLHASTPRKPIPSPTPICPDAPTFLHLIGRSLHGKHASKFSSWESLFSLTSTQLRELGVEPARDRRYILRWREKFRKGEFGIGGKLQHVGPVPVSELAEGDANAALDGAKGEAAAPAKPAVTEGDVRVAEVVIVETPTGNGGGSATRTPGTRRVILNVAPGKGTDRHTVTEGDVVKDGLKITGARTITGPFVEHVKGTGGRVARILLREGMWEHKRGRKIDGGERRRAEVRAKRRAEERKNQK